MQGRWRVEADLQTPRALKTLCSRARGSRRVVGVGGGGRLIWSIRARRGMCRFPSEVKSGRVGEPWRGRLEGCMRLMVGKGQASERAGSEVVSRAVGRKQGGWREGGVKSWVGVWVGCRCIAPADERLRMAKNVNVTA
jgi:hypothetical protein